MSDLPTWQRLSECPRCVAYRPNLRRTGATALIVGTVLFLLNHLAATVRGQATTSTWIETAASCLVPFCVANLGMLIASRRPAGAPAAGAASTTARAAPTWQHPRQWPRCVAYGPHLARTITTALVVGTIYFAINQLGTVLEGHATTLVWTAGAVTYLVPFTVSNIGVLIGSRRAQDRGHLQPA